MNEERTGKCLRQVEHIRGHLRHRYTHPAGRISALLFVKKKCYQPYISVTKRTITVKIGFQNI